MKNVLYFNYSVITKSGLQKPLFALRLEDVWQKDKKTLHKPSPT